MHEFVVTAARLNFHYAKVHLEDIPDERFCELPSGVANHPAWIVGHLVLAGAESLEALGQVGTVPAGWERVFEFGKPATADRAAYPGKAELMEVLFTQAERTIEAFLVAPASVLAKPLDHPMLKGIFPNVGSLVISGLTMHSAVHFGQLSVWRQAMGMPLHI